MEKSQADWKIKEGPPTGILEMFEVKEPPEKGLEKVSCTNHWGFQDLQ